MLGLVFTEFVECVETGFGYNTADEVQQGCPFATAFTAVDNYDHQQLVAMVGKLHQITGMPVSDLIRTFGHHMFAAFLKSKPEVFASLQGTGQLLRTVEEVIHIDVRSLHPQAELPNFFIDDSQPNLLRVEYLSTRPFADLAHGLLEASVKHFDERLKIERSELEGPPGTHALFVLTPIAVS